MNTVRASRLRPGDQVELVDGAAFILRGPHRIPGDSIGLVKFDLVSDTGRR
jgi:hypothetical protein